MKGLKCKILQDYQAKRPHGRNVIAKTFRENQIIVGNPIDVSMTPDHQIMALETKEGFIIPESYIDVLSPPPSYSPPQQEEYQEAEEVKDNSSTYKQIFKKPKSLKHLSAADVVENTGIKSKTTVQFAIGGMIIGLIYAMLRQKNKIVLGALGGFAGGTIGNLYVNATKSE
tara:strand:- start:772 stop:1284 length:513 start_codon:yes stop_codon:yes gene_type:complete